MFFLIHFHQKCVLGISILPLFKIFRFGFGTVLRVWYFLFYPLFYLNYNNMCLNFKIDLPEFVDHLYPTFVSFKIKLIDVKNKKS